MIARRRLPVFGMVIVTLGLVHVPLAPSYASIEGCVGELKLDPGGPLDCENIAALTPSNDTRVNLMLLLLDRYGTSSEPSTPVAGPFLEWPEFRDRFSTKADQDTPGFPVGEGSRCRSNETGLSSFETEVGAAKELVPDERAALLTARKGLVADCAAKTGASAAIASVLQNARSTAGTSFATYLHGVDAFYGGRFDDALKDFEALKKSDNSWLADSASYMVARTQLNLLQVDAFDQYGSFAGSDHVDQQAAARADESLRSYLIAYPKGRFVASAQGLLRRVAWLAGWTEKLAAQYAALLASPPSARPISDTALVDEIDNKLLPNLKPEMTKDPILLAVLDLKAMRKVLVHNKKVPTIRSADVDAQRDAFASTPLLHEFLLASSAFYVDGTSAAVIKTLPDDTRRRDGDHLWFSRQLLRGMALEAANDRNTRGFWTELYQATSRPLDQSTIELALALHEEKRDELKAVFATGSIIKNSEMRIALLDHVAGPALLRGQAHDSSASKQEQNHALSALLYKELTRGLYADFLSDVQSVPTAISKPDPKTNNPNQVDEAMLRQFAEGETKGELNCPPLTTTVATLEADPKSVQARLCLAEFVRLNAMDDAQIDLPPAAGQLGSAPSSFPGKPYGRATTYQAIIKDKDAVPADRAYALYREVKCYEPTGINACGGPEISKATRKAWYYALKREYPRSRWAESLQYWW
jgi:hypothetical protein